MIAMSQLRILVVLSIDLGTADHERNDWIWDHSNQLSRSSCWPQHVIFLPPMLKVLLCKPLASTSPKLVPCRGRRLLVSMQARLNGPPSVNNEFPRSCTLCNRTISGRCESLLAIIHSLASISNSHGSCMYFFISVDLHQHPTRVACIEAL